MDSWRRFAFCLAVVCGLYAFHVHLKTAKIFANPTWNAQDEVGQFWSEFAFHYRFAKFFAEHPMREWTRLARDRDVQYPDTINDWTEFTVAMEAPVGVLYRWLKPATPFHLFVVWYDCLVSSLSLFAVFFLARALWHSDWAGTFASGLYAALYPGYGRTVKNLFLREDFAVPLIIFALVFTVRALEEQKVRDQVLAAVFWLAALASWHLTQFVMAPLTVAAVLVYLGKGETPRVPWLVFVLAGGAVLIPVLRAKEFYVSPTMCLLYALSLAVWINGGRKRATILFAGSLVVFLAAGALLQKSYGEYAHVYELFFSKLRFLGVKPADPSALPWEARLLWEGAFDTATWREWWHSLEWCLPLALVAMGIAWRQKQTALRVMAVFTLLLFPLAWMVVRYFTFLGFAAAVLAAGLITRRLSWKLAIMIATVWQLGLLNSRPLERQQPTPSEYRPIVNWLRKNTPTNAVVLASISESPVFLAHTGRPIILHSKFENQRIRKRYREMLEAIYESEEHFYMFARKYGATYFVYDAGFIYDGADSRRYKADKMGTLDPDCAAMLFADRPERLQHFKLEISNSRFAVFRVLTSS
ncbi:MAG TPA: hypothetical protein VL171_16165 [Verrucomicrobiae bacterium]|nr:hypothetical protein [Verrucomicrobiae bacterium]